MARILQSVRRLGLSTRDAIQSSSQGTNVTRSNIVLHNIAPADELALGPDQNDSSRHDARPSCSVAGRSLLGRASHAMGPLQPLSARKLDALTGDPVGFGR